MNTAGLLADAFDRVSEAALEVVAGLSVEQLSYQLLPGTNSIGWLMWHLTRVQDDHVADAAGVEQAWTSMDWVERFGLPFESDATGYGQSPEDVAAFRVDAELLTGYHEAVHAQTIAFLGTLKDADLDRVVDDSWDPPVTLGVRLVSVISDDLQHAGQAAFIRGKLEEIAGD